MEPEIPANLTYRHLSKPLCVLGCEKRIFFLGIAIGWLVFSHANSVLAGLFVFAVMFCVGTLNAHDPHRVQLILSANRYKAHYDPGVREPHRLNIHG